MDNTGKIFWNSFIRQLKELYYLLYFEKCISCGMEEFMSHFTGKKFRDENKNSTGKIKWTAGEDYFIILIKHLLGKCFLNYTIPDLYPYIKKHFTDIPGISEFNNNNTKNKSGLAKKLNCLLPEVTGLRCKQRLFYKYRNVKPVKEVLTQCGIEITSIN